ncbi:MAG TPA: alpha/beta fold hydrolase [Egibacteraceae bacterium]|nr:alpha/beta fold hydrolase [Egibacteraceae bacterium]
MSPSAANGSGPHLDAADALAPEAGLVAQLDPVLLSKSFAQVLDGLVRHPGAAVEAGVHGLAGLAKVVAAMVARTLGAPASGPLQPDDGDKRFRDPAWQDNLAFLGLQQTYLLWRRTLQELVDAAELEDQPKQKAQFGVQLITDALAPTNFLPSNPDALKKAFDTGGVSLLRGLRNLLDDVANNKGRPRQVDTSPFEKGKNLAATAGKVVFRNQLMELIQYEPQTDETYEIPLLCSPPWINKYYIMDLAPDRSFIEWAVQHGHTVFSISYRNPGSSLRDVRLDDYLISGPRTAIDVIRDITGADKVNIVGLCLGGTLTVILLAYLDAVGDDLVNAVTLLNTLIDYSDPGPLGAFTDPDTVAALERRMSKTGYLKETELQGTFDLLRGNDLIWNYVVNNWLKGEDPPAFDILAWNYDSTRMPANMHSFYLRSCYLRNELARGQMEIEDVALDLEKVDEDIFIVGAENDHIAPWKSSYKTTNLVTGEVEFVLTSAGHIAGIVNPPNPKSRYWLSDEDRNPDPDSWLANATEHEGSWWHHWVEWMSTRSGVRRPPPPMGSDRHPPIADAPGTYINER